MKNEFRKRFRLNIAHKITAVKIVLKNKLVLL